jgi:hypothetical protein
MTLLQIATFVLSVSSVAFAFPQSQPFKHAVRARQDSGNDALTIDLGYGVYRGYANASTGLNTWRG